MKSPASAPRSPRNRAAAAPTSGSSGSSAAPGAPGAAVASRAPSARLSPPTTTRGERRLEREQAILREAEAQFARNGFEGTSLEGIAAALGLSRHLLLYYFPSKEALYRRVIDDVLTLWLEGMGALAEGDDPAAALRRYVGAKLRSSAERPDGSRVFTQEVMAGAPRYADALVKQVLPVLKTDVRTFERWARAGRVRALPFTHLMFVLWAATQAYADLAPQFALLLGKPALDEGDFAAAQEVIEALVLAGLGVQDASAVASARKATGKAPGGGQPRAGSDAQPRSQPRSQSRPEPRKQPPKQPRKQPRKQRPQGRVQPAAGDATAQPRNARAKRSPAGPKT